VRVVIIFGRPFVKRFAVCYQTVVCPVSLSCLSVTLVCCGQTVERIKMKLGTLVGLGPGHIVLDVDPAPLPPKKERDTAPQFLAYVCCGQTARCIKMPLGMGVGLGPGNFVLDGDPPPPQKKGTQPFPNFRLMWPNGWVDQDATWYRGRPQPRRLCVRWHLARPPPQKKGGHSPQFSAHVCCGQTTRWIKMPLGTEVGLSQSNFVLDGDPAPPLGISYGYGWQCLVGYRWALPHISSFNMMWH